MKAAKKLFCLLGLLGGVSCANAQFDYVGTNTATGLNGTLTFPQFNPNLGTLSAVIFQVISGSCVVNWYGVNGTTNTYDFNAETFCDISIVGIGDQDEDMFYNSTPIQIVPNVLNGSGLGTNSSFIINFPFGSIGAPANSSEIGTGSITFSLSQDMDTEPIVEGYPDYIGFNPTLDQASINETISLIYNYEPVPEPSALDFVGLGTACLVFYTLAGKRFNILRSGSP